ncbi:RNI-like protein [Apiospora rasikravindrae]|uniref:RNI-like protein n=1 Tax=Apiospora rasikravindrae TaxID=990691 RepID=A0ABR1T5E7_9PEZI
MERALYQGKGRPKTSNATPSAEPPKNAAQEIIDGKKSHRRPSLSGIRSPLRALRTLSISSSSQLSNASSSDSSLAVPPHERKRTTLRKTHASEPSTSSLSAATAASYGYQAKSLARAHSKASSQDYTERGSVSTRPTSPCGSCSQGTSISGDFVGVIKAGGLHHESGLLKTKKEFLVLTTATLHRFKSRNAALDQFPQLSGTLSKPSSELQIPLEMVVSAFKDEGTKPCFGIEVWWKDNIDGSTFTSTELDFNLPEERDEWLKHIRLAVKQRARSLDDHTPSDVEADFAQILSAQSLQQGIARPEIFPVIPRHPYTRATSTSGEIKKGWRDNSSFYLALGKNVCMLAQFSKSPTGQRVNPNIVRFGLVTLSKVNAHLGDERFDLIFRLPLDSPKKIGLSSRHHRSIISQLFKADTHLKPAWPLWTRREIFFVDGETDHIHLPEGEDYGGFKRTLEAFLEGYHCPSVDWKVNWESARFSPEFQLLRPKKRMLKYSGYQLLAVFRALRFNDYFKSLNFDGVDFSALSNVSDNSKRLEPTPWLSRTGKRSLTRDEYEIMEHSPVLFQEIVGLMLASESVRQVNFNGVLSGRYIAAASGASEASSPRNRGCDLIPPIVLLLRSLQMRCKSVFLNGNPMSATDVSDLCQTLQNYAGLIRCLGLSRCDLDEVAMISVWEAIHEQRSSLETLEFANNFGRLDASRASQTLNETPKLRHLDLSYCLKGGLDGPLFQPWTNSLQSNVWRLEYLDLSGWKANFDTISCLLRYMETEESNGLKHLILNNCGIDGEIATSIICGVGSGRDMHLHLNGNPLELRSTDWIDLIEGNEGPNHLHMNMVQFDVEDNFNKLLQALTNNSTIEFLSLVGTGSPAGATPRTLELLSKFFESNTTLQYLDLSGYSGKLEDSHMGWGLSGALGGLKHNSTLRQLRLRNHNIGDAEDVTELCRVLAANQGLVMFDLQNNQFNHHQLSQIVRALDMSHRIISFPLCEADRKYALTEEKRVFLDVLHSKHKTKKDGSLKPLSKTDEGRLKEMQEWLQTYWDTEARKLADILKRNRENPMNMGLEFEDEYLDAWEDDELPGWLWANPAARVDRSAAGSRRSSVGSMKSNLAPTSALSSHQRRSSAASQHFRTASAGSFTVTPLSVAASGPPLPTFSSSAAAPTLAPPSFLSEVDYGGGSTTSWNWDASVSGGGEPVAVQPPSIGGMYTLAEESPFRESPFKESPFGSSSSSDYIGPLSSVDYSSMTTTTTITPPERNVTPPPQQQQQWPQQERQDVMMTPPSQTQQRPPLAQTPQQQMTPQQYHHYQIKIDSPEHQRHVEEAAAGMGNISPGMTPNEYRQLMEGLDLGNW